MLPLIVLQLPPSLTRGGQSSVQAGSPARSDTVPDLSCRELDDLLTALAPQTYSDTPEFYRDPLKGSAIWVGTLWSPAWAYLGYAGLQEAYQHNRRNEAGAEMDQLRRLKARQHCYEQ